MKYVLELSGVVASNNRIETGEQNYQFLELTDFAVHCTDDEEIMNGNGFWGVGVLIDDDREIWGSSEERETFSLSTCEQPKDLRLAIATEQEF